MAYTNGNNDILLIMYFVNTHAHGSHTHAHGSLFKVQKGIVFGLFEPYQ